MEKEEINWHNINDHQSCLNLPEEVWKYSNPVNSYFGCGDLFEVSNYGRVRRLGGRRSYSI